MLHKSVLFALMRLPQDYRSLARVLKAWNVVPAADPIFREKIWRRVGSGDRGVPLGTYVRANRVLVVGAIVLAVILGAAVGWMESEARAREDQVDLAAAYVRSVDARWMKTR
jgi:hypothetical protein